jgi:hypothetical protein
MRLLSTCFLVIVLFFLPAGGKAQPHQVAPSPMAKTNSVRTDSAKAGVSDSASTPDDMPFALIVAVAFFSLALGGAIIGAFAATLCLIALLALVSAGILSAGILVGLYKRSVAAGFKTLLVLVCSLGGVVAGAGGFWLIHRLFHIHLTTQTSVLLGAAAGLLGGMLLGIVLFGLIRAFLEYCRQKLSLRL